MTSVSHKQLLDDYIVWMKTFLSWFYLFISWAIYIAKAKQIFKVKKLREMTKRNKITVVVDKLRSRKKVKVFCA